MHTLLPLPRSWPPLLLFLLGCGQLLGQSAPAFTLEQCLDYALENRPALRNARLLTRNAELNNDIALSAWKPFVTLGGGLTNNIKQQVSIFPSFMNPGEFQEVTIGTKWTSNANATATQLLYSPAVALDARLQNPLVERARLDVETIEIQVRAEVEAAFYQTIRRREEIDLVRSNIERLERALRDARLYYEEGIADKVDYKRATIARNRARQNLRAAELAYLTGLESLKQTMGYPTDRELTLQYAFTEYVDAILTDSLLDLNPRERVELRALVLDGIVQDLTITGARQSWLPQVSASAQYSYNWQANTFGDLYARSFPAAYAALNVNVPLFSGFRRFRTVELETVRRNQIELDIADLRDRIELEYATALNGYGTARESFMLARENSELAQEVYDVVLLQYREGIEPFLEVVIAENDLQVARINTLNALVDAMLARLDLRVATGTITTSYD